MKRDPVVPEHTVRYFGPGVNCIDAAPGDLVLVEHSNPAAKIIRFGERLRCHGPNKVFARVNHAATALGDGTIQEMVAGGGVITPLATYKHLAYAVVHTTSVCPHQRALACRAARFFVGVPYGFGSILSDALYLLTGLPFALTFGSSVVCSTDASTVQRCLGFIPGRPDVEVLPSDLARWYGVRLP